MLTLTAAPAQRHNDLFTLRHLAGLHAEAMIAQLASIMEEPKSMLSEIIDACRVNNPWEVLEMKYDQILAAPDSARCFLHLFKDAMAIAKQMDNRSDLMKEIHRMVGRICMTAENRLIKYRDYESAVYAWELERKNARRKKLAFDAPRPKLAEGCWPADIYRATGIAIRYGMEVIGHKQASKTFKALLLESTIPLEELEYPDWVDSYTGVAEEREKPIAIRTTVKELDEEAAFIRDENLTWTMADFAAFQNAQRGGFNADADAIVIYDDDTDSNDKDFEFKGDYATTDEAPELRTLLRSEISALRKKIEKTFAVYQLSCEDLSDALDETRNSVIHSSEATTLMRMLKSQASHFLPQDVAAVALEFQSEFCWTMEELNRVRVANMGLGDWIEAAGENFLEQFQDASPNWAEITQEEIDLYSEDTVFAQALAYAPKSLRDQVLALIEENKVDVAKHHFWNVASTLRTRTPGDHPLFIAGSVRAAIVGTQTHEGLIAAGWEAFRSGTCYEGNQAYHNARSKGASHPEAMKAFWRLYNLKFPRQVKILKPFTDGLLLEGGRKVDWHVAALKLLGNELDLDANFAKRLYDVLAAKNVGIEFTNALAAKYAFKVVMS
ncbi:MAG: hypothetical protein JW963_25235 [Anaerolineales bacterium]|nr:hypothetical protein [Anaerolineales bacterium]